MKIYIDPIKLVQALTDRCLSIQKASELCRINEDTLRGAIKRGYAMHNTVLAIEQHLGIHLRDYIEATATFVDTETNERICVAALAREDKSRSGSTESQLTGATSSYARKYALNGLYSIDDTKDADATNTHGKEEATIRCDECGGPVKGYTAKGRYVADLELCEYTQKNFNKILCYNCVKARQAANRAELEKKLNGDN